jgi:ABC-type nitrate/sulfonate/bicarbonate transport system substrate-binding protein
MMFDRRDALKLSAGAATSVALGGRSLIAIAQDDLNLRLQLGWIANVEYAGVWLALERGYFRQRGIDLQYAAGGPNSPPPPVVVASGNADIGYTTWLPFLDAVARGNEFVMIGATFPVSPLGIISLAKRPIRVPADLVDA